METSVEQQLLTCQEIEQKVSGLSAPNQDPGGPSFGASDQESADLLSSELELLKAGLMSVQRRLEERQSRGQQSGEKQAAPAAQLQDQGERPLVPRLQRSGSVQEMFSSPRNKLLRQSSIQQQKELEQELMEQRGLTRAIARQHSRGRLHSQDPEVHSPLSPWPFSGPSAVSGEDSVRRRWEHLHNRLLALEDDTLPSPAEKAADSSVRVTGGMTGGVIDTQLLKDLQTHILRLEELGFSAEEIQGVPDTGSHQRLDEGVFDLLCGTTLSLSSLNNQMKSPPVETHMEEEVELHRLQLQSLSAELASLGHGLASQGSKVMGILGSEHGQQCLDLLSRVLPVVQTGLTDRLRQCAVLLDDSTKQQRRLKELHAGLGSNQSAVHQLTNKLNDSQDVNQQLQAVLHLQESIQQQASKVNALLEEVNAPSFPVSIPQQASQIQGVFDGALEEVCSRGEELRIGAELQRHRDRLVVGLKELVSLGSERLSQCPSEGQHGKGELEQRLGAHTKFFQSLGSHLGNLQYLVQRVHNGTPQRWEGEVTGLQEKVARLQEQALERGTKMEHTLQVWVQWEEACSWLDNLLIDTEPLIPKIHMGLDSEEEMLRRLSVYQNLSRVLEESRPRFRQVLEAGLWLKGAGCSGVGVVTQRLETCWNSLHRRVEQDRNITHRNRKLQHRFTLQLASLSEWMGGARELIDRWKQSTSPAEQEPFSFPDYRQFMELSKELEAKSELNASAVSTGTLLCGKPKRERGHGDELTYTPQSGGPEPGPIPSLLSQLELDWSCLQNDVSEIQKTLHQGWMERLGQQGALVELNAWLSSAEARLMEHCDMQSYNKADLSRHLHCYKDCQREMHCHQATLDYINHQVAQICSTMLGQVGRYEAVELAEKQGFLNQRWLSLEWRLNSQIQEVATCLRTTAERQERMQQISSWTNSQRNWLNSALSANSQSEVAKNIHVCEDLQEKIEQKSSALQQLGDQLIREDEREDEACSLVDAAIESCTALSQQNGAVRQRLTQVLHHWDRVEKRLGQVSLETMRKAQTLCYHGNTQPSLQAQGDLQKKLQRLHEEALALDTEWTGLSQDVSLFQDNMSPAALALLTQRIDTQRARWVQVRFCVDQARQRGGALLEQWRVYAGLAGSLAERLNTLQEEMVLVGEPAGQENAVEQIHAKIRAVGSLQERTDILQTDLEKVRHACKNLMGHLKPMTSALVQSESRLLSRGVLQLSQSLAGKLCQLQEELGRLMEFDSELESLERHLQEWQDGLMSGPEITYRDQSDLLETCGLTSDLDALNELSHTLTLGGAATHLLQKLNHGWAETTARAMETCSVLQGEALRQQSFDQKCESWTMFLQRMEESLAVDLLGSYTGLRQQLRVHQRFQAEFSIGHQILHSVISEALVLLQRGEVDDRSDFLLKLAQLREHWQGALQRAAQRRSLVEGLVKHWHLYSRSLRKLQHFLSESQALLPPAGPPQNNLQQLRRSLQDLQHTALLFQRYQYSYIQTLEVGRHLFSAGDQETQDRLQSELGSLQEDWDHLHGLLGKRLDLTRAILQNWERCEARLDDSMLGLKDVKTRLNQSMPEYLDDLQSEAQFYKENQDCLEDWAESLSELASMKTDLSQYIMADDVLLLQEQVEHLHCQWEDLCLQVSMRKQEIADRLNAWIVFNEKNKELCDWLAQMEDRVAYDSDVTIEDMVEKLKKDCMEEINLFSENKSHLKQLGEQLISASNRTKETEVNDKLKDVTDRWQHLFDHIETRVRKLKETLLTIQQLDKNMSNLRTWLSRIEAELSKPVVYHRCHGDEIQKKLSEQQELQRDIEQHTEGVASVLTLCDVLLHDADACVSEAENDSIQQTSRSLDRRWRNICAMSMERRMRIEETWRLWCKFLDDYARFEDWLRTAEVTAANPMSADVLYTIAKEELKRFEAFQRQVHERLTQLELVNKQYRRLARENRTDAASKLKVMVQEGNRRWDILQRRVSAVLRRLKHFTSQREDFEGTREGILVWLTEMDLQLTNVEHFSESDVEDKMKQLNVFQKEITLNTNKIDALIVFGENLIQKSASLDAVLLEDELEELHSYCQEVFGRVARFHQRLLNRRPVLEEDRDLDDLDDSGELASRNPWGAGGKVGGVHALGGGTTGGQVTSCHLLVPPLERSGRETPVSVDSIPLEWDHTVDVGGSSSHEEDEDATFFSALSDVKVIEGSESFLMATARAMVAASVKSVSEPPSWHQPSSPVRKPREGLRGRTSSPKHTPTTPPQQQGYTRLMSECSGSINSVKRVKLVLNDEEELEETGLSSSAADKHTSTGVIERWELFQAQTFSDELDNKHALEQWKKLNSDLCDVTSWLGRVLPELERLQRLAPSTSLQDIEGNICRLKEMQRTFNSYKCLMISVNLSSRHLQRGDSAELAELQDGLHSANHSWTQACAGLQSWETCLRRALLQCQEFHETLHSTLLWLARAENKLHAVNIQGDAASHSATRDTLMALEEQLHSQQQQVTSLQDISSQLLLEVTGEDGIETKEKVHVISNKLRLLLRQVASDLHTLQGKLEATPTSSETDSSCLGSLHPPFLHPPLVLQKEEVGIEGVNPTVTKRTSEEKRDSSPPRRLFFRVLRAAFPLHLLFLLLLVLACLVPMSEEPHSCTLSNNFARSFYPMLRYTNGPPPT